MEPPSTYE